MSELEKLKAQNAELADRIAKLEEAAKPPEPFVPRPRIQFDPTEGASMPRSAMKQMVDALPSSFFSDLRADSRKPNAVTGGPNPGPQPQVKRGSGWVEPRPLESPPGLKYVDAQLDAQDAKDRAELALKIAKVELGKGK